ncbi:uncharacterized protein HRG_04801 [Hirsutella rhossiliensis]|uniref:SMP-LTD domain-containing protein n=1 Tax=Hirsutella rhossiliensis TaxID=111463 RepID=A0A9P8MXX9_9HYPO|nr:uncharacterized protein HRG_04801 [Hirsutella rhossiliensis]KAH0964373.1 hypothetical protein HRG_04801 [Hirsutella rhossiliensis]
MGGLTAILVAYVVGGVTFIPLVLAVVFAHGFYTLPHRHDVVAGPNNEYVEGGILQPGDDKAPLEAARKAVASEPKARANRDLEVAAGYFAVCREYTPMGINAKPIERSTPLGSTTVAPTSPSVYQTMYRSIFDRKPASGAQDLNGLSQRPKKAGNVFYVVLRHGHLMLFDDEEQLEVRHVISLAHHDISIYSGGDATPEGELFIKRNALCLSRKPDGIDQTPDSHVSKPFYLFSENCSAKEDFYFALLKNQEQTFGFDASAPKPKQFDVKNIISLVQRLHSSEDHVHSRWLNAVLGRLFLAVYKTRDLENFIRDKITNKISRVKRPSFLTNITIQGIDTGEAAPCFTNLKLKDLTVEGECVVEADVRYTGNFRIQVGATVKIDLGARFKAREVNLVLAVLLKRVEGHVLFKIKAPPSNRLWFSFQTMPKMEMAIEPIVSSRQITYTVILRQIENRIKEVFAETLVLPFWDDVPFFRTEHKRWRGGIFESDDALESSADADASADQPSEEAPVAHRPDENAHVINETPPPLEKSHSLPVLERQQERTGLFGRKLGKNENNSTTSVVSTGVDAKASSTSPLRSPSILKNSTDPIVGTETAHADLFKPSSSPPDHATHFMAALHSRSQDILPVTTPTGSPVKAKQSAKISKQHSNKDRGDGEKSDDSSSLKNQTGTLASTESSNGEVKRGTLAAVTNAAAQARQWGWNAIQRQKDAKRGDEKVTQVDLSQPMGRGQPLPPPGVPLPGPTNGSTRIVPVAAPKRKLTAEQAFAEAHETDKEQEPRPVPPSSLPQNRRRGASPEQMGSNEQKMLVVAAPDDSQPGTPHKEMRLDDGGSWAGITAVIGEEPVLTPESLKGRSTGKCEASLLDVKVAPASPLIALPAAAAAVVDDDDDFSGWMEDDILDEEQHDGDRLPAAVVGSVQ